MKVLALLSIFLALPLAAQTAQVVQLTPEEAAQAKALYTQQAEIAAKIEALRQGIVKAHLLASGDDWSCVTGGTSQTLKIKRDWACGDFEYSADFKFIVPSKQPPAFSIPTTSNRAITIGGDGSIAIP